MNNVLFGYKDGETIAVTRDGADVYRVILFGRNGDVKSRFTLSAENMGDAIQSAVAIVEQGATA